MIRLTEVGYRYPSGDDWVLRSVSAELPPGGGVLRLSGPNGAGKTTLLRLILGLLTPTAGRIEGVAGRARAAVFQDDRLLEHLTPVGNVRLVTRTPVTNGAITCEFEAIGLAEEAWDRPVAELSGGQRRRVCLVRALMASADVVALDEPFTGIDAASLPAVMEYARARLGGADVILVTHDETQAVVFGGTELLLDGPGDAPARTRLA